MFSDSKAVYKILVNRHKTKSIREGVIMGAGAIEKNVGKRL